MFQEHLDLAVKTNELILIHTPHLEDKYKGTRMIVDMLKNDKRIKPERVCIDHVEEHTVRLALDNGFWCGMTLLLEVCSLSNATINVPWLSVQLLPQAPWLGWP